MQSAAKPTLFVLTLLFGPTLAVFGNVVECGSFSTEQPVWMCSDGMKVSYQWLVTAVVVSLIPLIALMIKIKTDRHVHLQPLTSKMFDNTRLSGEVSNPMEKYSPRLQK